jgi:NADPH:quinone reductase
MRALLVGNCISVDSLRLQDVASPTVARGHVRVRVKAAGIGFVDALKIAGRYQTKDALPFVPGMEFSGTVDEAGEDVSQPKVGDRVFGSVLRGGPGRRDFGCRG